MDSNKILEHLLNKIDNIDSRIDNIDKTMAVNTASLEEHVKRTNILEKKLEPVEDHVKLMNAVAKLIALTSTVLGVLKLLSVI